MFPLDIFPGGFFWWEDGNFFLLDKIFLPPFLSESGGVKAKNVSDCEFALPVVDKCFAH